MARKAGGEKDAQSVGVEATFRSLFRPNVPKEFGSSAKQLFGLSDQPPGGVKWSAWYDYKHPLAYLAVNLEGMKHETDDWPIGRLIERELKDPRYPGVFATFGPEADVEVEWDRDALLKYRVPIREKEILRRPVQKVDAARWRAALMEAAACLGEGLRGRAMQPATLPHKGLRDLSVSPHLQFRTPPWEKMPAGHDARAAVTQAKRDLLAPLHALATELTI